MVVSVAHDGDHELVDEHGQLVDTGLLDELVDDLEAGGGRRRDRAAGEGGPGEHSLFIREGDRKNSDIFQGGLRLPGGNSDHLS